MKTLDLKPASFVCSACKATIDLTHTLADDFCGGSGYAITAHDDWICYPCAGAMDLLEMNATGTGMLYLTSHTATGVGEFGQRFKASNWPGTLSFDVYGVRHSWHNFAGENGRRDFYFDHDGFVWHGVNIGDMQCSRVRRTKRKAGAK